MKKEGRPRTTFFFHFYKFLILQFFVQKNKEVQLHLLFAKNLTFVKLRHRVGVLHQYPSIRFLDDTGC